MPAAQESAPAVQYDPCPPPDAILYAASGEPLLNNSDVTAHAHLQHCAICQQTVASPLASALVDDEELLRILWRMLPWRDRIRALWPHWTIGQRVSYVALIIPLLLRELCIILLRWRDDLAYGMRCVRARRASHRAILAGLALPPPESARDREARKARFLADLRRQREAHLLAACQASRGVSTRTPRPDRWP